MPFPVDVAKAFRFPSELKRLVEAVHGAGDYDETRWIEWKRTLDLSAAQGIRHIAKQILGFANRDPQVASTWAQGYAYLVIGVSPGVLQGVALIDPERLVSQVRPFVGSEITWTPECVRLGDFDVLVIIVNPPRQGDDIHVLRKDLPPHQAGTVLIRRHGQVGQADVDEMRMLQRRLRARAIQVELTVEPIDSSIEARPDLHVLLATWSANERARFSGGCTSDRQPGDKPTVGSGFKPGLMLQRMEEERATKFDEYIELARQVRVRRAVWWLARHRPAKLGLRLVNLSERNFTQVRVDLRMNPSVVQGFDKKLLQWVDEEQPKLPKPPTILGSPTASQPPAPPSFNAPTLLDRISAASLTRKTTLRSWRATNADDAVNVQFDPIDLRPLDIAILPLVPLIVSAAEGETLSVDWEATATNANGQLNGSCALTVAASSLDGRWMN